MVLLLVGSSNRAVFPPPSSAGSAEGHPSAGRSLKSTDNSYSSTPDSEVLLQDSNVVGKTLVRAVIDRSVLLKPVKPRPLPSPAKAPNPMQDLEIPTGTPGFVLGKAGTGKPAPFSVDMVFQNSSRANQSEPQPSGANDLAYGRLVG